MKPCRNCKATYSPITGVFRHVPGCYVDKLERAQFDAEQSRYAYLSERTELAEANRDDRDDY